MIMIFRMYASFAVIYFSLYFMGYSLKVLLLNDDLKKFDLYITPWLGIGVIVAVLYPLSWLGYSVESVVNYFAAGAAAVNVCVWLKYGEPPRACRGEAALLTAAGLVTGLVYGAALAIRGPDSLAASGTADFGVYLNVAKSALVSSARAVSGYSVGVPLIDNIDGILNIQLRGSVFVSCFFAALYRVDLPGAVYGVYAFVMFLNAAAFRLFLKGSGGAWRIIPIIAIFPLNIFYQALVFMSFMGQLFSFGLVTLAFYLEYYLSERGKFDPKTCAVLVFIISVNALCWLEGILFPLLPALALCLALLLNKRYDKKSCLANAAFTGGLWLVSNFKLIFLFIYILLYLDGTPQGWPMPFVTFAHISGLRGVILSEDALPGNSSLLLAVLANGILIPVLIYQLFREKLTSFMSLSFMLFLLLHMSFCLRYFDPGEKLSYNAFKSALSLSFIAVILIFRFIEAQTERALAAGISAGAGGKRTAIAATAAFFVFFALNADSCRRYIKKMAALGDFVISTQYEALGLFAETARAGGAIAILNFDEQIPRFIAAYYTRQGEARAGAAESRIPGPDAENLFRTHGESSGNSFKSGDIYVTSPVFDEIFQTTDAEAFFENDVYRIFRLSGESVLASAAAGMDNKIDVKLFNGEYVALRRILEPKASFKFVLIEERPVNFAFSLLDENAYENFRVKIYFNGELLETAKSRGGKVSAALTDMRMKPGVNELTLELIGDISKVSLSGMRIF